MPVIAHTKTSQTGGSTLDALVVGEAFSGRIRVKTTKEILLSYTSEGGPITTEEGSVSGKCYIISRQSHTLKWKAKIKITEEKTTISGIVRIIHEQAINIEQAGANITVLGGGIFIAGAIMTFFPPTAAAGPFAMIGGGGTAVIAGVFWAGGAVLKHHTKPETTISVRDEEESGTETFESTTVDEVECSEMTTYTQITIPTESKTPEEAKNECILDILQAL